MSINAPNQREREPIEVSPGNSILSRFRSKTFTNLARGAALAAAFGLGAAACSSSSRSEEGSRPDAGAPTAPADGGVDAGPPDAGADAGPLDAGVDAGPSPPEPPPPPDFDRDGVPDNEDQCLSGDDNADIDNDGLCDTADPCPVKPPEEGRLATEDNDGDGIGTRCDLDDTPVTGFDPTNSDADLDRVLDRNDGCTGVPNGAPQVDGDGDGAATPCDCNDSNPAIHPAVPARIPAVPAATDPLGDGDDSDCNGVGQQVGPPNPDGTVVIEGEETYTCIPGTTRDDPDGVATGECEVGTQTCLSFPGGSAFGVVSGGVDAVPETCNTLDDDCDGTADEDIVCDCDPGATRDCGTDEGKCEFGRQTCGPDRMWGEACAGGITADEAETCDGEDDDCDGEIDEGFGVGEACSGVGGCGVGGAGVKECASPSTTRCSTNPGGSEDRSVPEKCDSVDNDCDREVDEEAFPVVGRQGTARTGTPCEMVGVCSGDAVFECFGEQAVRCNAAARRLQEPPLLESPNFCNGFDDDCDARTDEGCSCVDGETIECGISAGVCNPGDQICRNGAFGANCEGTFVGPSPETCNGVDDNCDDLIDNLNGRVAGAACIGVGRCGEVPGVYECISADELGCSIMPGGSASRSIGERCNGVDDDCDGEIDEEVWPGAGAVNRSCNLPEICGGGLTRCRTEAETECSSIDRASPPTLSERPNCEGLDNDCDGATDEGCACLNGAERSCGESRGACVEGTQTCSSGVWGECFGDVGPTSELCNGVDEDCDDLIDNGFGVFNPCRGRGECGANIANTDTDEGVGVIECAGIGTTRCSVNPGGSSDRSSSELCNGQDDDCDGVNDDGIGALGLPGTPCSLPGICDDGTVECSGLLGTRCSSVSRLRVEVCNGADDDCDGSTDEGFNIGSSCSLPVCGGGVLRCANPSSAECSSIDNATPDAAGDDVDQDCDGVDG